jgi:hypothetical protein
MSSVRAFCSRLAVRRGNCCDGPEKFRDSEIFYSYHSRLSFCRLVSFSRGAQEVSWEALGVFGGGFEVWGLGFDDMLREKCGECGIRLPYNRENFVKKDD